MDKTRRRRALHFVLAATLVSSLQAPVHAATDCNPQDKAPLATWFPHERTPEPPPALTSDTNCAFHVWSWQTFLYLTQVDPGTGEPRFLSLYTLDELFAPLGSAAPETRKPQPLRLTPRLAKSDEADLDEFQQAGSAGVLVDQERHAVYYSQQVSQTFYDFVRSTFFTQEPGGTFDPGLLAAATGVKDFFPSGSLELKASWKIVDGGSPEGFFTLPAEIYLLQNRDGKIVVDPDRTRQVTVALVGMHVAGVVDGHPEFIWATFEHVGNAPDLPPGMDPGSSDPVSDTSWTFYAAGTPADASNRNPGGALALDQATQTLDPVTNVFRQYAYGTIKGGPSADTNVANIRYLNDFVAANFEPGSSAWRRYLEVGAIWMLPDTLQPNQFPITQLRGSTMLSNSTMETYTQSDAQCFSCHNTLPVWETVSGHRVKLDGTNFNLSHILVQEYFRARATDLGVAVRKVR